MQKFLAPPLFFMLLTLQLAAQDMMDSVFVLKTFEISSSKIFEKETAGMKETTVDTLVLMQKINLSLSDVLSQNTPVFIKDYGRGALATASFRGTAESHTQVNWNGINITSPMAGMTDFSLIPVYVIDDMTLKYGSASIADQSGGLGGSIDINNVANWNNKVGVKFLQGIGSYNTINNFLMLELGNPKFQSKTRLYYNYSKNDYTFVNKGIGEIDPENGTLTYPTDTNHNAAYSRYGFLQEFYFKPDNKNILSAKWWFQNADRTIPQATSYEGSENSNINNQLDRDNKIVVDWKLFGEQSQLLLRSGYSGKQLDYTLKNFVSGVGEVPAIYSESTQNSFLNTASISFELPFNFSIEATTDFNYHEVVSRDTVSQTGYEKQRTEFSGFVAVRKNFADRLNLNLMLRQEWIDFKSVPFIPYLGFDYRIIRDKNLILKANIARNYHKPSLNDLYWEPGGNPDLKAEDGMSYELGLEYTNKIQNLDLKTELTAFYSDINNWIIWIPSYKGYWEPQNIKQVVAKGVEANISLNGKFGEIDYYMAGNYAYTKSTNYGDQLVWGDESYGKQLVYIPVHSGNALIRLGWKKFHIAWQHSSYSERFTTSSNDVSERNRFYPYYMNDLILGKDFDIKNLTISAEFKIYNLFNESYHSVLYRPMPGQNYLLMLMIKY